MAGLPKEVVREVYFSCRIFCWSMISTADLESGVGGWKGILGEKDCLHPLKPCM